MERSSRCATQLKRSSILSMAAVADAHIMEIATMVVVAPIRKVNLVVAATAAVAIKK